DKTSKELSIILGNRLQRTRINYYRKLLGYTYKKNLSSSQKGYSVKE
ncbi:putative transposase, partial [Orientia tsutsugamushi str. UT76]